jgi:PAS domain S-box-containing protein
MTDTQILIVEDESIVAEDIKSTVQKMGYSVAAVVSSGEDAVRKAEEKKPNLILMDIMLRGKMNGIEAAGQIRSAFNIPVIYLTAYADEKIIEDAKLTEPFGYITKPFENRELHSSIEMALYKHKIENSLRESRAWLSAILGSITDAVVATDINGHVIFMNSVAEKMTGMEQGKAAGKNFEEAFNIINEKTEEKLAFPAENLFKEAGMSNLAVHILISANSTIIPVAISVSQLANADNTVKGVVIVLRNITERKKMEQDLKEKVEDLKQFYEMAIGRELNMKELKEELQKLSSAIKNKENTPQT